MNMKHKNPSLQKITEQALPTCSQMLSVLTSIPHLYSWSYNAEGTLLETTCPHAEIFHALFVQCGYPEKIIEYAKKESAPYALSIYMGLVWYAILEKKTPSNSQQKASVSCDCPGQLSRFFLLGPVFQYPVSPQQLDTSLRAYESLGMTFKSRRSLIHAMEDLPIIPHTQLASYAILLHRCVTGETVSYQQLHSLPDTPLSQKQHLAFSSSPGTPVLNEPLEAFYEGVVRDFSRESPKISPSVYRLILQTEEFFRSHLLFEFPSAPTAPGHENKSLIKPMAFLPTDLSGIRSPLGKMRLSAALLTYFCARTAVESGMTCEQSYRLADEYLGRIEAMHSPMGLQKLMGELMADYSSRLKKCRENRDIPQHCHPNIRLCVDYIRNHSTEPISLETLARLSGWSTYYFSRKFKKDMGISPSAFVRREKIKYAAHLLKTTEDSIDEILEKISLSSRSHFSEDFTKIMGMPPGAYRKQKKS